VCVRSVPNRTRHSGDRSLRLAMIRRLVIAVLAISAAAALGIRLFTAFKTPAWRSSPGGFQVVLTPQVWVWAVVFHENVLIYILRSKDSPAPTRYPERLTRRISRLTFGEFGCYGAATDIVDPGSGFQWWTFDFSFPDTTLHPDPGWPDYTRPVRVPGRTLHADHIGIPLSFLAIVFAVYPVISFIRGPLRRWRRLKSGGCVRCGYDLTGNVSGICPECGEPI